MDFGAAAPIRALVEEIGAFVRAEIEPREGELLARGFRVAEPELAALRQRVRERGFWAPPFPRDIGGLGLGLLDYALVSEPLGRSVFGHYVFGCQAPDAGNIELLRAHGTEAQKGEVLAPLARGEIRTCFALTEPDRPGSDPTQIACAAVREGGGYALTGRKWFASGADGARYAIVMAVTDPAAAPHARASLFVVPTATPGFRLLRNIPVMGHPGEGWLSHGELELAGCRVPESARLGAEGAGFRLAQERLGPGRIHHCMRWIGICERAFELMCARAAGRRVDGSAVLAETQIAQAWIAEARARIDAARLMVLRAAWTIEREGFAAAREQVSLVKFFTAETLGEVVDRALQLHGALGMTSDTPLAFYYAHERAARIYDGPDEVHKLAAARRILERYRPR